MGSHLGSSSSRDQGVTCCERSSGRVTWAIILTNSSLRFPLGEQREDVFGLWEQSPPAKCSVYVLSPWMGLRVRGDGEELRRERLGQVERQELGCWSQLQPACEITSFSQFCFRRHVVGNLKMAVVGVFTPQKLKNTTNQNLTLPTPEIQLLNIHQPTIWQESND